MEHKFDFGYLDSFDIEKEWKISIKELLVEFTNFSVGSKFILELIVNGKKKDLKFSVDQIGDKNLLTSLLQDKPKTIKKMFSEDEEYRGGIIYKIFSEWFCPELNNVTNKVLKVIICSTNNAPILPDYSSPDSIDTISKLIIIILDDGFVMGIYNETNGESNFISFSPSLFDFRQYLNLKNLKKNLERDQLDFLNIILQLLIEKIFDKSKKIMFDRLCKFKEESTVLLETFEKLEKDIKGKFLKIENINDEIEEDLMNSITNIKKIGEEDWFANVEYKDEPGRTNNFVFSETNRRETYGAWVQRNNGNDPMNLFFKNETNSKSSGGMLGIAPISN